LGLGWGFEWPLIHSAPVHLLEAGLILEGVSPGAERIFVVGRLVGVGFALACPGAALSRLQTRSLLVVVTPERP